MKTTFRAYVSYGKLDTVEYEVDVDISEEEYRRVVESAKTHMRFSEDPDVGDIYEKAYHAALRLDINVLRDLPEELNEKMTYHLGINKNESEKREYTDDDIAQMLKSEGSRCIGYPEEMEDLIDNEKELK